MIPTYPLKMSVEDNGVFKGNDQLEIMGHAT
jgi:hypothetical protein